MPDLHALLAAEAHRLEPDSVPAFDDLLARGRRRRAARATATVLGVALAVVAVVGAGSWLSPRSSTKVAVPAPSTAAPTTTAATTHVAAPTVSPEVYAKLSALAVDLARNNDDPNPTRLEAVMVNPAQPAASRQSSPSSPPLTGGYLLQVQGHFVCTFCKGHGELLGTVISQELTAPGLAVVTTGFGDTWQDLTRYGTPFSLPLPAPTSAPAVAPSASALNGPPVNPAKNKKYIACMKSHDFPGEIDPWHPPRAVMESEDGSAGVSTALANRYRAAWQICVDVAHF